MPDEILIFAPPRTQLVINRRIFELVAIGNEGAATWRTRCVVCHSPVFSEVRSGKLPTRARCNAHMQPSRHPETPTVEYQYQSEIAEMALARPAEVLGADEFVPSAKADAVKRGMEVVGQARAAIVAKQSYADTAPLKGFVRMHMGDEAETSVETSMGEPGIAHVDPQQIAWSRIEDYTKWDKPEHTGGPLVLDEPDITATLDDSTELLAELEDSTAELLAELEEMAPEGEDQPPPPPPDEDVWIPRLEKFYRDRMWLPSWGDRPDQAGCRAPREYLDRYRRS